MREIHKPLGDLVTLAEEAIMRSAQLPSAMDARLDKIVAELTTICTAKPSRKQFVDCAKVLSICLRKLFLARQSLDSPRVTNFESSVGHFLPFVRNDIFEAMHWEREQAQP
jgi:hypothetical protein